MEEFIKNTLQEILELDDNTINKMGNDDDLVNIGLDSLKAIELVVYVEDNYGITISDDDLLIDNISTINKIANMIKSYNV